MQVINGGVTGPGVSQVPTNWADMCGTGMYDKVRRVNFAPPAPTSPDTARRWILRCPWSGAQGLYLLPSIILEPDHHEGLRGLRQLLRPDPI